MSTDIERHIVARLNAQEIVDLLEEPGVSIPKAWHLLVRVRGDRRVEVHNVSRLDIVIIEDAEASARLERYGKRIRKLFRRLRERLGPKEWRHVLALEAALADRQAAVDAFRRDRDM